MVGKNISHRLDAIISPLREEFYIAQQQAMEKVQQVISHAESEVAQKSRFMTSEQRMQNAETEIQKAEEHLLGALSSMYKALCYIAPQINPLSKSLQLKDVKGKVEDA